MFLGSQSSIRKQVHSIFGTGFIECVCVVSSRFAEVYGLVPVSPNQCYDRRAWVVVVRTLYCEGLTAGAAVAEAGTSPGTPAGALLGTLLEDPPGPRAGAVF
eukprot:1902227-Pyramimonas_sp.AAC.1